MEMPKGHMNQTHKNVRSTKPKLTPPQTLTVPEDMFNIRPVERSTSSNSKRGTRGTRKIAVRLPMAELNTTQLRGKKVWDVYTKMYDARSTIFSDQTDQFPTILQQGSKYTMVMVEIDSNAILVEPLTSHKDPELTQAYLKMIMCLKWAGIIPKKHVLNNKVSKAMKDVIHNEYQMEMKLVPLGCHWRNAAEVAIRNFKAHSINVLAETAEDFSLSLWDCQLPQAEITINLC